MIDYKIFTLPNGIDVLFLQRPEQYSVYIDIVINAGSIYETPANSGVSHFFEHLLFEGTKQYPSEQLLRRRQQEIGLSVGASTHITRVHIQASLPKMELLSSLEVLRDMVYESLFIDESIQKERRIILDEQRQRRDSKRTQLWEFMAEKVFGKEHVLSLSPGGTITSVTDLTPDVIRSFYKQHVTSRNSSVVIGGNYTFEEVERTLKQVFLEIPEGTKVPEPTYDNSAIHTGVVAAREKEGNQEYFMILFPSYAGNDLAMTTKHQLLNVLLNEELHKKLRADEGLLYGVGVSDYTPTEQLGLSIISGSCNALDLPEVLIKIQECIDEVKEKGFETGMLQRIREAGNKTLPMQFDTLAGAMSWCVGTFHDYRKVYLPDEVLQARNKVTEEDILRTAREVFLADKRSVVCLGPLKEKDLIEAVNKLPKE